MTFEEWFDAKYPDSGMLDAERFMMREEYRYVWDDAIEQAGDVLERTIAFMKAHTNPDGIVSGEDFFATELAYLEPVLKQIRALDSVSDAALERSSKEEK